MFEGLASGVGNATRTVFRCNAWCGVGKKALPGAKAAVPKGKEMGVELANNSCGTRKRSRIENHVQTKWGGRWCWHPMQCAYPNKSTILKYGGRYLLLGVCEHGTPLSRTLTRFEQQRWLTLALAVHGFQSTTSTGTQVWRGSIVSTQQRRKTAARDTN